MDRLIELFEKHNDQYHNFANIPEHDLRNPRNDLCAFIYLYEKLGGQNTIISSATHDEIWLNYPNLENLTEEDVIYLLRCGVQYDSSNCLLWMFI